MKLSRRQFLAATTAASLTRFAGLNLLNTANASPGQGLCKAFVVGDAHFGWNGPVQPTPAQQLALMNTIMSRFPDLDIFVDTGDAHHNYATDTDKANWTDTLQGGTGTAAFLYAAGNHEVDKWNAPYDPEETAMQMGSVSCRPYFSFDIKGVHFISLPQLAKMNYITEESLEWLKLDLNVNASKTTVIFSHNALAGTTEYYTDIGYRQVVNSDQVLDLINQYPNVLAWMHGHNHTYELVPKYGKLFVSVGRIGGFNPSNPLTGSGHLGGFYVEVGADHFTIKAYSASQDKFLDEYSEYDFLTHTIFGPTSYNPAAPAAMTYGFGKAPDGHKIQAWNYHSVQNHRSNSFCVSGSNSQNSLASGTHPERKLYVAGTPDQHYNFNKDLDYYTERTSGTKIMPGFSVAPNDYWHWSNQTAQLLPHGGTTSFYSPLNGAGKRSYFQCAPGKQYKILLTVDGGTGGQRVQAFMYAYNNELVQLITLQSSIRTLAPGSQQLSFTFTIPSLASSDSIYSNPDSDLRILVSTKLLFSNLTSQAVVHSCEFMPANPGSQTQNPAITVDGETYSHSGTLAADQFVSFDLPKTQAARTVIESASQGTGSLTWMIRTEGLTWQVRNALVTEKAHALEVGPIRNPYTNKKEIIIVPLAAWPHPYVHRLLRVNTCVLYPSPQDKTLEMEIKTFTASAADAQVIIHTTIPPVHVRNAAVASYANNLLTLTVGQPGKVSVEF